MRPVTPHSSHPSLDPYTTSHIDHQPRHLFCSLPSTAADHHHPLTTTNPWAPSFSLHHRKAGSPKYTPSAALLARHQRAGAQLYRRHYPHRHPQDLRHRLSPQIRKGEGTRSAVLLLPQESRLCRQYQLLRRLRPTRVRLRRLHLPTLSRHFRP